MSRISKGVIFLIGLVIAISFTSYNRGFNAGAAAAVFPKLPSVHVYSRDGKLLKISIEDVGKYHGDICPGVVIGYRAVQAAILKLWGNETPYRSDFKIISRCPTWGPQDAFEFITRAKTKRKGDFRTELPEGTDIKNVRADNFVFIIIRKSTQEALNISVKKSVFPKGFFRMRAKMKHGKPSSQEKEQFKRMEQKLRYKFMNLPLEDLFTFSKHR